jgi:solute carrier family 35 (GDP-fucose transporter), member C1
VNNTIIFAKQAAHISAATMGQAGASPMEILRVVSMYWIVSISMVYLNKYLVTGSTGTAIPAPLFLTWFQCAVTVLICWACGTVTQKKQAKSAFAGIKFNPHQSRQVAPLSAIFVGMIAMNNLCLQRVEVSFYNVARSLTLLFNVVLGACILGSSTTLRTKGCLALVVAGFFLGTQGELNFSLAGSVFGVLSSLFVSLNAVFTKKVSVC